MYIKLPTECSLLLKLRRGRSSYFRPPAPFPQTLVQHKKSNAASRNVETAVETTAMMIVFSCSSFLLADEAVFLAGGRGGGDLVGGKNELLGDGDLDRVGGPRLRLGGGEGEGETGLEARFLLGV